MGNSPVTLDFSKAVPLAAQPGAFQSKPGGPIQNANVTLDFSKSQPIAGPGEQIGYSGLKDIVPMENESFEDTMKRAIEYGKTLTPADLERQTKADLRRAPLALAAGPVMAGAQLAIPTAASAAASALAPTATTETVGTGVLDALGNEVTREVVRLGPSAARAVLSNPIVQKVLLHMAGSAATGLGLGGTYALLKKLGVVGD